MGFAEYADLGASLRIYRIRIWGGALDLLSASFLLASFPSEPDTYKSLEPSSWSVDQGGAWESARPEDAETGGKEGPRRAVKIWKRRSMKWAGGSRVRFIPPPTLPQGSAPGTPALCLLHLVHLLGPVGQLSKVLTPLRERHYQAKVNHSGSGVRGSEVRLQATALPGWMNLSKLL